MGALGEGVRAPLVTEKTAIGAAILGVGATTTVVFDVASLHAGYLDLMWRASVDLASVALVFYAASRKIVSLPQIVYTAIGPDAGVTNYVRWGGSLALAGVLPTPGQPIGQNYDVVFTTAIGSADGVVTAWTAARS